MQEPVRETVEFFLAILVIPALAAQPVADLIRTRFPNTLDLTIWAVAPVILVGIWLGVQAAVHQNSIIDQAARIFSIVGTSFPTFVFGLLMLMIFYVNLGWFPPGRMSDWASIVVRSPRLPSLYFNC